MPEKQKTKKSKKTSICFYKCASFQAIDSSPCSFYFGIMYCSWATPRPRVGLCRHITRGEIVSKLLVPIESLLFRSQIELAG